MASAGGSLKAGDGQCRNSHRSARAPPAVRGHAGHITRCYETAAHSLNSRLCRVPGGDRHFCADGAKPGQALTLIEAEALEDVGLTRAQSRRQVVVRECGSMIWSEGGCRVGDVECAGVELCEPCLHLQ